MGLDNFMTDSDDESEISQSNPSCHSCNEEGTPTGTAFYACRSNSCDVVSFFPTNYEIQSTDINLE